eukprot:CAMPEP_0168428726 /NCGR_PEP_ID=MMETSP0228-20121227/37007_1 /TAXON_ID=133427 /ORGANISM="Protoceratium reticulatum, Strain CCCM 535 (=CCMP 1889)" /LENGTH=275 /DNA_ID=CAMNT_0008442797 /DNA_START=78 /DNA_END=902 /DNA_ORIENTATION=-
MHAWSPVSLAVAVLASPVHGLRLPSKLGEAVREDAPPVAVCLAGMLRTFLWKEVQDAFMSNFHRPGYEYFLSVDEEVDLQNSTMRPHVRAVFVDPVLPLIPWDPEIKCPKGQAMHKYLLPQADRIKLCHEAMENQETARNFTYKYIIRTRPDIYFERPIPSVPVLQEWKGWKDVMICDDFFAFAERSRAGTVLLNPAKAYSTCHDRDEWTRACGFEVGELTDGYKGKSSTVPCCPMRMITIYDNTTLRDMRNISRRILPYCSFKLMRKDGRARCP